MEILILQSKKQHANLSISTVSNPNPSPLHRELLTLVRVMLNWMVRITTRISKLPKEISVKERSVYQLMFFRICGEKEFKARSHEEL